MEEKKRISVISLREVRKQKARIRKQLLETAWDKAATLILGQSSIFNTSTVRNRQSWREKALKQVIICDTAPWCLRGWDGTLQYWPIAIYWGSSHHQGIVELFPMFSIYVVSQVPRTIEDLLKLVAFVEWAGGSSNIGLFNKWVGGWGWEGVLGGYHFQSDFWVSPCCSFMSFLELGLWVKTYSH